MSNLYSHENIKPGNNKKGATCSFELVRREELTDQSDVNPGYRVLTKETTNK